ncbi:uncharacterized protein TNCV_3572351 [Trichonephila clavipes]|nr:uncharacterized protein TNCV_3572351 [Trichonephila clavipes]
MIANYINDQHGTWDQFLRKFAYTIRTAVNKTTGKTHAELFFGRKLITPFQKLEMVSDGTDFATKRWKRSGVPTTHEDADITGRTSSIPKSQRKERQPLHRKATGMSDNWNVRRRGDQQQEDQERKGAIISRSISLEVLAGDANYKS